MVIAQTNNGVFDPWRSALQVRGPHEPTAAEGVRQSEAEEPSAEDRRSIQRAALRLGKADVSELSPEEQAQVRKLRRRDQEVRTHEAAHMAASGAYARGGASYSYTSGPDGKRYAVGGEVSIDTSSIPGNPEATAAKMQTVRRAALAPAKPSAQDMAVAARAAQAAVQARMEAVIQAREEGEGPHEPDGHATARAAQAVGESHSESPANENTPHTAPARPGDFLDLYA